MGGRSISVLVVLSCCVLSPALKADESAATESPQCAVDEVAAPFVLPSTGAIFSLPPIVRDENGFCPAIVAPVRPLPPHAFGSVALPIKTSSLDGRWTNARTAPLARSAGLEQVIVEAAKLDKEARLSLINLWVNEHIAFSVDGDQDQWAPAADTIIAGHGDCEDFAILKHAMLEAAGIPADAMFLVLVRDIARGLDHAVLAVSVDGELLILDNRTDRILPSSAVRDYRPVLAFTGPFAWTYGDRADSEILPAQ